MKKSFALALVLAALMLVTVMAVSVSADPSITLGEVVVDKDIENNLVTVTVPYTAVDVPQITLIATKGTEAGDPGATEDNIVYVAQQASTVGSFTFSVYYDAFSADLPYMWIKVGGTSIETAEAPGGEEVWETLKVLIYGDVNDDGSVTMADYGLVSTYVAAKGVGLDETDFPNGTFVTGSIITADVNGDGSVTMADYGLISTYVAAKGVGLDETDFPNGKFPADK